MFCLCLKQFLKYDIFITNIETLRKLNKRATTFGAEPVWFGESQSRKFREKITAMKND